MLITNVNQGDKAGYAKADRGCARSASAATPEPIAQNVAAVMFSNHCLSVQHFATAGPRARLYRIDYVESGAKGGRYSR
ncbi:MULTISPECIES: hypothetical protein [Erwiniaceae]|uniref:hypothetical protein n=1 Tax=Erwiniaceae TaxID=1903409 RepID=UPI001558779C|nr:MULTISPECIES: hypothetical protein [Erwiniaceae]